MDGIVFGYLITACLFCHICQFALFNICAVKIDEVACLH